MGSRKMTNVLLLVLVFCLAIIALGLDGRVILGQQAEAQSNSADILLGCHFDETGRCVPTPVRVTEDGYLMVRVVE